MADERALGEVVPISVATAQLFELRLNLSEEMKKDTPAAIFFNVKTLFRNYYEAYKNLEAPPVNEMLAEFREELDTIKRMVLGLGIEVLFYLPTYNSKYKLLPNAIFKDDPTGVYAAVMNAITHVAERAEDIQITDCQIPKYDKYTWVVTSFPIDLLSIPIDKNMVLFESHTGAIKRREAWITKLTSNSNYMRFPFNHLTMTVLGDKANMLYAFRKAKYRDALLTLATDFKWTPYSSNERIVRSLNSIKDKDIKKFMLATWYHKPFTIS